jgi:peptidoglycan hydrolase CwlO-like protein
MLLKQLCTTQGEELKALKEAFPAIFKEMSEIQEMNYKQEKELDTVQTVITPLQAEIASLQERIACLTADLKQVHPPLSTF